MPTSVQYQEALKQLTEYFVTQGSALANAEGQAFGWIAQHGQLQASFLAFIDVFWMLMLVSAAAVPIALIMRSTRPTGAYPQPTVFLVFSASPVKGPQCSTITA